MYGVTRDAIHSGLNRRFLGLFANNNTQPVYNISTNNTNKTPTMYPSSPNQPIDFTRQLLAKIETTPSIPALGQNVAKVISIASDDNKGTDELARFILSDVALTNKILHVANTPHYRTAARIPVTTISRAIYLLGFETVKAIALAMMVVENLNSHNATLVQHELLQALAASIIGREVIHRARQTDSEETAVAALFKNLGRLLAALYEPDLYQQILHNRVASNGTDSNTTIPSIECHFDTITASVLERWQLPASIIGAIANPPAGILRPTSSTQERLQQIAAFSSELSVGVFPSKNIDLNALQQKLLQRYGNALRIDAQQLQELMEQARAETQAIAQTFSHINIKNTAVNNIDTELLNEFLLPEYAPDSGATPPEYYPSGKPHHAREHLLNGMQNLSQAIATRRYAPEDLMLQFAEQLQDALGLRFVAICLKDERNAQYRATVAIGSDCARRRAGFGFPEQGEQDLFHLALSQHADIVISDATQAKVKTLLSGQYARLVQDAASFIILPLLRQDVPVGLIYADRLLPAPEGITADEASLIKALKAQLLIGLGSGRV